MEKQTKKIAVVGPSWPFRSGIARETTLLAKELQKRGSLAGFFTPFSQFPGFLYPGSQDRDPHFCPNLEFAQPTYSIWKPHTWRNVVSALNETNAEVIVTPYWTIANAPFFTYLSMFSKLPVVAIVHNLSDHEGKNSSRITNGISLRGAAGFLAHTGLTAQKLGLRWPGKPVLSHLIPPPPCEEGPGRKEMRDRLGLHEDEVAILFAGLIRPYKGLEELLEAMTLVPREKRIRLVMAGETWEPDATTILRKIRTLGIEDRVSTRFGWVPPKELAGFFEAADAAVLPYRESNGSGVAASALAYGLPLLVSEPLAETVENGSSGRVILGQSAKTIAEALIEISNHKTCKQFAIASKKKAATLTWETYTSTVEKVCAETRSLSLFTIPRYATFTRAAKNTLPKKTTVKAAINAVQTAMKWT